MTTWLLILVSFWLIIISIKNKNLQEEISRLKSKIKPLEHQIDVLIERRNILETKVEYWRDAYYQASNQLLGIDENSEEFDKVFEEWEMKVQDKIDINSPLNTQEFNCRVEEHKKDKILINPPIVEEKIDLTDWANMKF